MSFRSVLSFNKQVSGLRNRREYTYTVMRHLTTGIPSEKCVVRRFRLCSNVIECTYTNLDSIAYYKPRLYGKRIAPMLQTCTTRYCTEYCRQL